MTYKPMTDEEWAKLLGDDYPNGLYYGFYGDIEQAILARIESQGLVIVPRGLLAQYDIENVEAILAKYEASP